MKIIILGSSGFIGSNCVKYFLSKNHHVWTAGIKDLNKENYYKINKFNPNYIPLFEKQKYDICINASGSSSIHDSFTNTKNDFSLNVLNVQKLLATIKKYNTECKIINFSSAAVYGNPKTLPISENSTLNPISPYGKHKLESEKLLTEYSQNFGLKTCSLRIFSAYGPGQRKQIIWDIYQKYLKDKQITLFGDGNESRDYIYIDDIMEAIEVVIHEANFKGEAINIATGIETSISSLVETFFNILDPSANFQFTGEKKVGHPINWCADIRKISNMRFKPKTTLTEGLYSVISWIKDQKSG